jgi:NTP pyrophosphatase (non-canonical NTP hydrolase)
MVEERLQMKNLNNLQIDLKPWLFHNFPEATSDQQLKGVMEELGELCHADLKCEQKIRDYTSKKTDDAIKDAIGDLVIYLCNYCTTKGIVFNDCIDIAFNEIIKRDWVKYPIDGLLK